MQQMTRLVILVVLILATAVRCAATSAEYAGNVGKTLYTQCNMWFEDGKHRTTNYGKGTMLPVGSEVIVRSMNSSTIVIASTRTGAQPLTLVNVADYSGENNAGIFARTLAHDPPAIEGAHVKAIRAGTVEIGMSKDEVIQARGYPPKHRTPTLDAAEWTFWRTRFDTNRIEFDPAGVVTNIVD